MANYSAMEWTLRLVLSLALTIAAFSVSITASSYHGTSSSTPHLLFRHHLQQQQQHHHYNRSVSTTTDKGFSNRIIEDSPMGCKELRSKRYISDGSCTSVKPITEVVCSGYCLPVNELPWYAQYVKSWARKLADEWRCVDDIVRNKRVYLLCENGERRSYRIRVVRTCKCKKYKKPHNKTTRKKDRNKDGYFE